MYRVTAYFFLGHRDVRGQDVSGFRCLSGSACPDLQAEAAFAWNGPGLFLGYSYPALGIGQERGLGFAIPSALERYSARSCLAC